MEALTLVRLLAHDDLRGAASALGEPLVLTREAAVAVLIGLRDGEIAPPAAQTWASFVRRGYIAGGVVGPVRPIAIDYEDAWEDEIAATISRLDEIGDAVDGEVTEGEVLDLLQLLGVP